LGSCGNSTGCRLHYITLIYSILFIRYLWSSCSGNNKQNYLRPYQRRDELSSLCFGKRPRDFPARFRPKNTLVLESKLSHLAMRLLFFPGKTPKIALFSRENTQNCSFFPGKHPKLLFFPGKTPKIALFSRENTQNQVIKPSVLLYQETPLKGNPLQWPKVRVTYSKNCLFLPGGVSNFTSFV